MDAEFAAHLQFKFRYNELARSYLNISWPQIPSGSEVRCQLFSSSFNYYIQRRRSVQLDLPPKFLISFQPTNFHYTLHITS